jgi:hypothetical protein
MADVDCAAICGGGMSFAPIPSACGAIDPGYPYSVLLTKAGESLATADLAGVQAQMAAIDDTKAILIGPFTNGIKKPTEKETESGADTPDGLETVTQRSTGISGNLKTFNQAVLDKMAELGCHDRAQMWVIYSNGYLEGGTDGHLVTVSLDDFTHDGYGTKGKVPLDFNYVIRKGQKTEFSTQDSGFLTLNNA